MAKRIRGFEKVENGGEDIKLPTRSTKKSAGYDLHAYIRSPWYIPAGETVTIPTGVTVYMQDDEELQIRPRSGLAAKHGLTVLNSPGTVDSDYFPNEVGVILHNTSKHTFVVNNGDRIAQGVFSKYLTTDDDNVKTERTGGFGSTGK